MYHEKLQSVLVEEKQKWVINIYTNKTHIPNMLIAKNNRLSAREMKLQIISLVWKARSIVGCVGCVEMRLKKAKAAALQPSFKRHVRLSLTLRLYGAHNDLGL